MNFDLSEEQVAIADAVGRLLSTQLDGARRVAALSGDADHDAALWAALAETGVAGIVVPEEFGGSGLAVLDAAIVAQELGRAAAPVPYWGHVLSSLAILHAGTEAQQARWLGRLATGETIGALAIAEGPGHWLPAQWVLPDADRITGRKSFVLNGEAAEIFVVGLAGGGLTVVERGDGVSTIATPALDGTRRFADLVLDDAPHERLEGSFAEALVDAGLVLLAADAFGGALACVERATQYAMDRVQFGVPIGSFQAIKHQIADVAVEVELSRALYWYAAHAWDAIPDERMHAAMLAKMHLADRFVRASRMCVEVHGGIGFTWECDAHVWLRRALHDQVFLCDGRALRQLLALDHGWTSEVPGSGLRRTHVGTPT